MTAQTQITDAQWEIDRLHEAACWAVDGDKPKDIRAETSQMQNLLYSITLRLDAVGVASMLYALIDSKRHTFTAEDIYTIRQIAVGIEDAE